ncbi:hypothetical protein [Streptomyces sp. NBC_01615]|uniref:hypothetical protein n=1 Tax=Streptomyces sp. NBC_01615 TaxID=2975898 RepID=UPI003865C4A2
MTTTQNQQTTNPPASNGLDSELPFLSLHTAVVLLAAVMIGFLVSFLTATTRVSPAAAVIAGLASAGTSIPVLRSLIQ